MVGCSALYLCIQVLFLICLSIYSSKSGLRMLFAMGATSPPMVHAIAVIVFQLARVCHSAKVLVDGNIEEILCSLILLL